GDSRRAMVAPAAVQPSVEAKSPPEFSPPTIVQVAARDTQTSLQLPVAAANANVERSSPIPVARESHPNIPVAETPPAIGGQEPDEKTDFGPLEDADKLALV